MTDARRELADFVFANSYARFNGDEGRRETLRHIDETYLSVLLPGILKKTRMLFHFLNSHRLP